MTRDFAREDVARRRRVNPLRFSPRLRFWVAAASSLFVAPALVATMLASKLPPEAAVTILLMAAGTFWLSMLTWVLSSHRQLVGYMSVSRGILVAGGLSIAMLVSALAGASGLMVFTDRRGAWHDDA